jgi:hypothetical protein
MRARFIRWFVVALVAVLPAGILAWRASESFAADSVTTVLLPKEALERGLACLAAGRVEPPLDELSEPELLQLAGLIGRLLHAYEEGAFESFLALRAADLEFAAGARQADLWQVQSLVRELGHDAADLEDCGWLESLRRFWRAYYVEPPVARFHYELSAAHLHREGLGGRSLEDWAASFEALREHEGGPAIEHRLVVAHRREIERVASDAGPLAWLDLELPFEARMGDAGRLLTRFVWDSHHREWFLHAATTVYAIGARVERHLIL